MDAILLLTTIHIRLKIHCTVKTGISKLIMKLEFQEVKITLICPPNYFICLDVSVYLTWRSLAKNFILNVQSWTIVSHALDSQL